MMPPLSEVVTRPEKSRPDHGETKHKTAARQHAKVKHVSHTSRPKAGGPCELEKRKSPETPVSPPARTSTPVVLKNKRQQPRRNSYTETNVNIVTQNIRGTQGTRDPNGTITDLGDIEAIVDIMNEKNRHLPSARNLDLRRHGNERERNHGNQPWNEKRK
jgi:hypothetical protein